jgi:hypothetical protein
MAESEISVLYISEWNDMNYMWFETIKVAVSFAEIHFKCWIITSANLKRGRMLRGYNQAYQINFGRHFTIILSQIERVHLILEDKDYVNMLKAGNYSFFFGFQFRWSDFYKLLGRRSIISLISLFCRMA